jgi:uncharacterized protein (DUF849 family)
MTNQDENNQNARLVLTGLALAGLLAGRNHSAQPYTPEELAVWAVKCADAAVLQLNRSPKDEITK